MPSMPRKVDANALRVAIVGGSMGGLTTALLLRTLGRDDVDVFEASDPRVHRVRSSDRGTRSERSILRGSNVDFARQHDRPGPYLPASQRGRFTALGRTRRVPFRSWESLYRALLSEFGRERYFQGAALVGF